MYDPPNRNTFSSVEGIFNLNLIIGANMTAFELNLCFFFAFKKN